MLSVDDKHHVYLLTSPPYPFPPPPNFSPSLISLMVGVEVKHYVYLLTGIWLMHCHIEFHNAIGMGLIVQVGEPSQFPRRPKNFPTCGHWKYAGLEDEVDNSSQGNGQCGSSNGGPNSNNLGPSFLVLVVFLGCIYSAVF